MLIIGLLLILIIVIIFIFFNCIFFKKNINGGGKKKKKKKARRKKKKARRKKGKKSRGSSGSSMPSGPSGPIPPDPPKQLTELQLLAKNIFMSKMMGDGISEDEFKNLISGVDSTNMLLCDYFDILYMKYLNSLDFFINGEKNDISDKFSNCFSIISGSDKYLIFIEIYNPYKKNDNIKGFNKYFYPPLFILAYYIFFAHIKINLFSDSDNDNINIENISTIKEDPQFFTIFSGSDIYNIKIMALYEILLFLPANNWYLINKYKYILYGNKPYAIIWSYVNFIKCLLLKNFKSFKKILKYFNIFNYDNTTFFVKNINYSILYDYLYDTPNTNLNALKSIFDYICKNGDENLKKFKEIENREINNQTDFNQFFKKFKIFILKNYIDTIIKNYIDSLDQINKLKFSFSLIFNKFNFLCKTTIGGGVILKLTKIDDIQEIIFNFLKNDPFIKYLTIDVLEVFKLKNFKDNINKLQNELIKYLPDEAKISYYIIYNYLYSPFKNESDLIMKIIASDKKLKNLVEILKLYYDHYNSTLQQIDNLEKKWNFRDKYISLNVEYYDNSLNKTTRKKIGNRLATKFSELSIINTFNHNGYYYIEQIEWISHILKITIDDIDNFIMYFTYNFNINNIKHYELCLKYLYFLKTNKLFDIKEVKEKEIKNYIDFNKFMKFNIDLSLYNFCQAYDEFINNPLLANFKKMIKSGMGYIKPPKEEIPEGKPPNPTLKLPKIKHNLTIIPPKIKHNLTATPIVTPIVTTAATISTDLTFENLIEIFKSMDFHLLNDRKINLKQNLHLVINNNQSINIKMNIYINYIFDNISKNRLQLKNIFIDKLCTLLELNKEDNNDLEKMYVYLYNFLKDGNNSDIFVDKILELENLK